MSLPRELICAIFDFLPSDDLFAITQLDQTSYKYANSRYNPDIGQAAKNGDVFSIVRSQNPNWKILTSISHLCKLGHMKLVERALHDNLPVGFVCSGISSSIVGGHLDIAAYMISKVASNSAAMEYMMDGALSSGDVRLADNVLHGYTTQKPCLEILADYRAGVSEVRPAAHNIQSYMALTWFYNACSAGSVIGVQYILDVFGNIPDVFISSALDMAVVGKHINVVRYLCSRIPSFAKYAAIVEYHDPKTTADGKLALMKRYPKEILAEVIRYSNLSDLELVFTDIWDILDMRLLWEHGSLDMIKFVIARNPGVNLTKGLEAACTYERYDIIEYLAPQTNVYPAIKHAMDMVLHGVIRVLDRVLVIEWSHFTRNAILSYDVGMVRFLLSKGVDNWSDFISDIMPSHPDIFDAIVFSGRLCPKKMLTFMCERKTLSTVGYIWDHRAKCPNVERATCQNCGLGWTDHI